jgi:hypothetical protein
MGIFSTITFEARYAGSEDKNKKKSKVVKYICDHIQDYGWQESIVNKLRNTNDHHTTLSIFLRLFDAKDIENGKLKSYARYKQKEDKLVIDQMLVLNEYVDLQEDEMRKRICDDVFGYLKEILEKYKGRFQDFDAIAFLPLLKKRIEEIKDYKLKDDYICD